MTHVEPGRSEPRDTLLLYCPYDRKVTPHARRGSDQLIVCLECGRPVDYPERAANDAQPDVYEQHTARFTPVAEPPANRRSQARPRPRKVRSGWLPLVVASAALIIGILAAVNVAGNLAAPGDIVASGARPAAATQSSQAPPEPGGRPAQGAAVSPSAEQPQFVLIANTGGDGAFLRRTTNLDDHVRAWQDNTRLRIIG